MKLEKPLKEFQNLHSIKYQNTCTQHHIAIFKSRKIKIVGLVAGMIPNAQNILFSKHNGKGSI
jgi:hypothetical protein